MCTYKEYEFCTYEMEQQLILIHYSSKKKIVVELWMYNIENNIIKCIIYINYNIIVVKHEVLFNRVIFDINDWIKYEMYYKKM